MGNYIDGKLEGPVETYHENGQLQSKGNYSKGLPVGIHLEYFPSRDSNGEEEQWFDIFTEEDFYEKKKKWVYEGVNKSKGTFKNGKRDGLWETYDPEGNLESSGVYKDGELIE